MFDTDDLLRTLVWAGICTAGIALALGTTGHDWYAAWKFNVAKMMLGLPPRGCRFPVVRVVGRVAGSIGKPVDVAAPEVVPPGNILDGAAEFMRKLRLVFKRASASGARIQSRG